MSSYEEDSRAGLANFTPPELTAADWYQINGRGHVAAIPSRDWPYDPRELTGRDVIIDGHLYRCTGVETFALPKHAGRWPAVGILIRGDRITEETE